jgi:aryl-alcohol dehydrogenase-like predicted oxidoreductase
LFTRELGRSGIQASAMGLGCWAIGGPFWRDGQCRGWGHVDDDESIRAIHRALDLGVTFFDTADVYGCGHSERLLGRALAGWRNQVVIATKFGRVFDERTRHILADDASPDYIRHACEASLRRLRTDYIDLYQLHIGDFDLDRAVVVRDTLEKLVAAGKIRSYGWSTDDPERARIFAQGPHCTAVQHRLNMFEGNREMLTLCEEYHLASINRSPLGMGLLTGKFDANSRLPEDDVRHSWDFETDTIAQRLKQLDALRTLLTRDGRTLAQGALGWLWASSQNTIPIPGFKTVLQVEENAGALQFGPLSAEQMHAIEVMG